MTKPDLQKFVNEGIKVILKRQWELELLILENAEHLSALESVLDILDHRAHDLLLQQKDKVHEANRKRYEEIQKNLLSLGSISPRPPSDSN